MDTEKSSNTESFRQDDGIFCYGYPEARFKLFKVEMSS